MLMLLSQSSAAQSILGRIVLVDLELKVTSATLASWTIQRYGELWEAWPRNPVASVKERYWLML